MATTNRPGDQTQTAAELQLEWDADPRWEGVRRDYTAEDVIALRGPVREGNGLAGMRERIAAAGGSLSLSTSPRGSLRIEASLPS